MASVASSERLFERISPVLHEMLSLSIVRAPHSTSTVFEGTQCVRTDKQRVVSEFESDGGWCDDKKSCDKAGNELKKALDEESVVVFLVLSGPSGQKTGSSSLMQRVQSVSIQDGVEELCDEFLCESKRLLRVGFGESLSLKLVGKRAFAWSGLREIHIPDRVEDLRDECFCECKSLSRVTFGRSSSLKRIGRKAFCRSGLRDSYSRRCRINLGRVF